MTSFMTLTEAYGGFGIRQPPDAKRIKAKKIVDDITRVLPISNGDEDDNFQPGGGASGPRVAAIEPFDATPTWVAGVQDPNLSEKIDSILTLLGKGSHASVGVASGTNGNDVVLYTFTGVFLLFVLDSMVSLGQKIRRF